MARGSRVRVANSTGLEKFAREWRYHDKLQPQQLAHAGQEARVKSVGCYPTTAADAVPVSGSQQPAPAPRFPVITDTDQRRRCA
jgi:hypothetical protein